MSAVVGHDLVARARTWIGTPYVHQARGPKGPHGGADCVGLLIGVAMESGLLPPGYDATGYAWETDGSQLRQELGRFAGCIATEGQVARPAEWPLLARPGDIAVFRVVGLPQHVGLLSAIDYGTGGVALGVIHAYNPVGRVVEHCLDDRWLRRLVALWRLRTWLN